MVRKIPLTKAALACFALALVFSIVELFRELEFDVDVARSTISEDGLRTASEFGSVFLTGYHLYAERAAGALPPVEWPMFFNDFISLVTFNDFMLWNPMSWYARNYFPDAVVAPFTLSPIADSALWGGEVDLALRGIVNGAYFALVCRLFVRYGRNWWMLVIYVYFYATSILTLKYSVFYSLTPLIKTVVPALLTVLLVRYLIASFRRTHGLAGSPASHSAGSAI